MRWSPLLLLVLAPTLAWCWPPNGVRLTGAPDDQAGPEITSDGAGGAFVSWADWRNFSPQNTGTDLYLQRVTAAGQVAPGWPVDGLAVATGPKTQGNGWRMLPDGVGGVLIVYGDTQADFGDLYLQRITAAGEVAPGWPAGGVPLAMAPGQQFAPELVGDGEGGAYVSWQDSDDAGGTRARYTHVQGTGEVASGWPSNGRLFAPGPSVVNRPLLIANGAGGFLACWSTVEDPASAAMRVIAQGFLADGSEDPTWPADGLTACSQRSFPVARLVPDGGGGFFTLFDDYRNSPPGSPFAEEDLYAQHVLGAGVIAPGWPADGLPVSALPGVVEQDPSLCEDGQGGVFFAWEDYRVGAARVFGQHLAADGQRHPAWPALGLNFTNTPGFQLSPKLVHDGSRGAYVTWNNLESGGYRSYAQHLTAGGAAFAGWPASGLPVIPLATDQYVPQITADGLGGAIVAWEDIRNAERDVYAQRFVTDGVVATQVSLAGVEVSAGEVRVRWRVSGETRASVERRAGEGAWRVLDEVTADGTGHMSLVDRNVVARERYEYRLAFANGAHGGEVSVVVPAEFALALEGARPNPASGPLWVAFTLPDDMAARLELFDLAGRRVVGRDVGARGTGRHLVRLDDGPLATGLYWASLTHGGHTLRERVAVVR